jgi:4-hydroxy-tetrahydrodipicolinate reductase
MKIFIVGANGRMGQEIQKVLKKTEGVVFCGGISREAKGLVLTSFAELKKNPKPDLVIDFSSPETFFEALNWCVDHKTPFFSGTTGLSEKHFAALKKASQKIPILWTANTSIGVQMVKDILRATPLPSHFKVQMTEWHHIHKKDKPSGTAIVLQKILNEKRANLPKPKSIRKGEIVGTHRIEITSGEEVITIEHKAIKRAVFARGAVEAGIWLANRHTGLYTMEDYLHSL